MSSLPQDILASIFFYLASSNPVPITHVCRNWRLLALDSPTLWSRISTYRYPPAKVNAYLLRSKAAPLHVNLHLAWESLHNAPSVLAQLHRIRVLYIKPPRNQQEWLLFLPFLSNPAPILQKFVFYSRSYWSNSHPFFANKTPMLNSLSLANFYLPWHSTSFRALSELILVDLPASYADIQYVLRSSPNLQFLSLKLHLSTSQISHPSPIHLPLLTYLDLDMPFIPATAILNSIVLPAKTWVSFRSQDYPIRNPVSILPPHLPAKSDHLVLQLQLFHDHASLRSVSSPLNCYPIVDLHLTWSHAPQADPLNALAVLIESSGLAHASHFHLYIANGYPIDAQSWRSLLRSLPRLTSLNICHDVLDDPLLALTEEAFADALIPDLCPGLRSLTIIFFHFSRLFLEKFKCFVMHRREHGVPLAKLSLTRCIGLRRDDVAEIMLWIDDVSWDGVERDTRSSDQLFL